MLELCQRLFRHGHFEKVPPSPPTTLPSSSFDVVYAYSVFSHLNEAVGLAWVKELARALRPGGVLIVTTQGRSFLAFCEQLRREGNPATDWHAALARSFTTMTPAWRPTIVESCCTPPLAAARTDRRRSMEKR